MTLRQRWKQTTLANKLLVIIGTFAAFATILSVALAYFQYQLAVKSDKDGTRQTDRLITAAESMFGEMKTANETQFTAIENSAKQSQTTLDAASKAASDQLASQREALRLERRAWIGADQALKPIVQIGKPVSVGVQFVNTGQSPGLQVESNNRLEPVELGKVFKPAFTDLPVRPSSPTMLPGMRTTAQVISSWIVTEPRLSAIKSGTLTVYLYGRITYRDIFNRSHESGYCMAISRDLSGFEFCNDYNYAR